MIVGYEWMMTRLIACHSLHNLNIVQASIKSQSTGEDDAVQQVYIPQSTDHWHWRVRVTGYTRNRLYYSWDDTDTIDDIDLLCEVTNDVTMILARAQAGHWTLGRWSQ